ncbi:MAG: hypothetical protein AAGA10_09435 [Bacteroidota bacterium]
MKNFGSTKDAFEFNEIEVEEEGSPSESLAEDQTDDILKNLDSPSETSHNSSRETFTERTQTTPLYNIPIEALSRRERKRLMRLERKVQRRKLHYDYKVERARLKADLQSERRKYRNKRPPKYHWAFFLCCTLIGLGIAIPSDGPTALFIGMGLGFLFFVDPIYDKFMQIIRDI